MKQTSRSIQHHDLYIKYHGQDSEIRDLLGEYGVKRPGEDWEFIDKTGGLAISSQFELPNWGGRGFSEGLAAVIVGEKQGYIDKTGAIVIDPQFDEAYPFSEGFAAVQIGEKKGFIDNTGQLVISPQFNEADKFYHGRARVWIGNGLDRYTINKLGLVLLEPSCDLVP